MRVSPAYAPAPILGTSSLFAFVNLASVSGLGPDAWVMAEVPQDSTSHSMVADARRSAPHAVLDFTSEVPRRMAAADYFIGKPGPGAVSEALHCGLPVVTFRNAWTMPQERYNTESD